MVSVFLQKIPTILESVGAGSGRGLLRTLLTEGRKALSVVKDGQLTFMFQLFN